MSESTDIQTGAYFADVLSSVQIIVNDPSAISRCVNNEDGWRDDYYKSLDTVEQVIKHFAFNCVANGVERVNRLDGWADLPDDAVTMNLDRWVEFERVVYPDD